MFYLKDKLSCDLINQQVIQSKNCPKHFRWKRNVNTSSCIITFAWAPAIINLNWLKTFLVDSFLANPPILYPSKTLKNRSKLTIKAPKRAQWCRSDVFVVNYDRLPTVKGKKAISDSRKTACYSCILFVNTNVINIIAQNKFS